MPASWEPKVTVIEEAKQKSTMQMDELIGNLQTYKLKKSDKCAEERRRNAVSEEQRRNSKRQQQPASKAFKKAMKATWGETSDEESEVEYGDNENLALMAKSDTDSDNDSSENKSSEALNWLNEHYNRSRTGLGYKNKPVK
ncbi:hypothetical protein HAX54_007385 [Datura stramonium]|uniref:Uncharacterized protein n=1 Tax=Datura stramonium TaxID=4076 RepID=A0ABS8RUZ4_DATST|nr:hypothetical protein [Datura stramonium]